MEIMPNPLNFSGYDFKLSQKEFEVTLLFVTMYRLLVGSKLQIYLGVPEVLVTIIK